MPLAEALPIARQIAEALEAAHEQGIVHRDLKPANIKIRADGTVKVLDFGLAKALDPAGASRASDVSKSPTLTALGTQIGVILGTAAYMAPEQAKGKAVDRRADIWAFGVLLHEMLSGRHLFAAETIPETLAHVLTRPIDLGALPAHTPRRVRELLSRCLERDTKQRLRDIGEARIALAAADTAETPVSAHTSMPSAPARPTGLWLAIAAGCLLAGAALGALLVFRWRDSGSKTGDRLARTLVLPAQGRTLDDSQAISPDGRFVAYTAGGVLWLRNLAELEAREVKDSKGARRPFWSPRSDAVAFATDNALFRVSIEGERPVELCRFSGGEFTGGSWSAVKGIVFTTSRANWSGDVLRVPEAGGDPAVFTRAEIAKKERRLAEPHFLLDGRTLLYSVVTVGSNNAEVAVDRDGNRTLLGLGDGSLQPAYAASGHVVFTRGGALWAVPFSLDTLRTTGEAFRIARSGNEASVARDGAIVFARQRPDPQQLVSVDRAGKVLGTIGEPVQSTFVVPSISPDGSRVAVVYQESQRIVVWDIERGIETRLTGESERALMGDWLPGGREISYLLPGAGNAVWARRADGSGEPRVLLQRGGAYGTFSRDGAFMAYYTVEPETGRDLWAVALDKPNEPFLILRTNASEAVPQISPDGGLLAYQSDATGRWEVHVQPFPRGEGRIQVSVAGGQHATWNPQGGELFYVAGNDLMAVDVTRTPALRAGQPRRLFSGDALGTRFSVPTKLERRYSAFPDGRRFAVVRGIGAGTSDVVLADGLLTHAASEGRH
jgi:eukaryotic-like serine/threonine-protein kinase